MNDRSREVAAGADGLSAALLGRVNRSSALWQQFGFLCDVVALPPAGGVPRYYEEVPVAYAHEEGWGHGPWGGPPPGPPVFGR